MTQNHMSNRDSFLCDVAIALDRMTGNCWSYSYRTPGHFFEREGGGMSPVTRTIQASSALVEQMQLIPPAEWAMRLLSETSKDAMNLPQWLRAVAHTLSGRTHTTWWFEPLKNREMYVFTDGTQRAVISHASASDWCYRGKSPSDLAELLEGNAKSSQVADRKERMTRILNEEVGGVWHFIVHDSFGIFFDETSDRQVRCPDMSQAWHEIVDHVLLKVQQPESAAPVSRLDHVAGVGISRTRASVGWDPYGELAE